MRNKPIGSIRRRLVINTIIALSVPVIGFVVFFFGVVYSNYQTSIQDKNQVVAEAYADLINDRMQQMVDIMDYLVSLQGVLEVGDQQINERLTSLVLNYDSVMNLEILGEDGKVLFSGGSQDSRGVSRAGESFYKAAKDNPQLNYWSTPFMSTGIGDLTFNMVRRLANSHYLVIYVNIGNLSKLSEDFAAQSSTDLEIAITDEYGKFISHSNMDFVNFRLIEPYIDVIRKMNKQENHTLVYDGIKKAVVVERVDLTGWYVIVYQPVSSVYAALNNIGIGLLATMGFTLFIAVLLGFINANQLSRFVKQLSDAFIAVKANDYKQISQKSHIRELNELTDGYNNLMGIIAERDQRLIDLAYRDSLTGCANRHALKEELIACDLAIDTDEVTLIFLDVIGFKMVNDVFGHDIGDGLLKYIPRKLEEVFKVYGGKVFRLAADEFAVLLFDYLDKESIETVISPFVREIQKGVLISSRKIMVGLNIGYAGVPEHGEVAKDLIQYADIALLENKEKRELVTAFDMDHLNQVRTRAAIEEEIRQALENNRFVLYYQPQIKVGSQQIHGFEALIRMNNSVGDLVPPYRFIPVAEETGLIIEMGDWIIKEALDMLTKLYETYQKDYVVSVNISPIQLRQEGFAKRLIEMVDKAGIKRRQLYLEITESVLIDSKDTAYTTLMQLISQHFRISLDDFGTGYSSLSYLSEIAFSELKIDRAFIQDVEIKPIKRNLLEAITKMGHDLGMTIVAEGVENEEQLKICREYECDIIQGYYYAKPMAKNELFEFIDKF